MDRNLRVFLLYFEPYSQTFGNMVIYSQNRRFEEFKYNLEEQFESDVVSNSSMLFGPKTVYIDAKRRIYSKYIGATIPDGFLFDFSDSENPEFYLVEVELSKHDFYRHIFPQITKFFAFFKNAISQSELVNKLFDIIKEDESLRNDITRFIGDKEIYKSLKDILENSTNILLILDEEMDELPEIIDTYTDTWGKMVRLLIIKKLVNKDSNPVFYVNPEFKDLEYADADLLRRSEETEITSYTEEDHLANINEDIRETYITIKQHLTNSYNEIKFNPQRYYISLIYKRNILYFKFRKKKIQIVIMLTEEEAKKMVLDHTIISLSESVQKFYNGQFCAIEIVNNYNLAEIYTAIDSVIEKMKRS